MFGIKSIYPINCNNPKVTHQNLACLRFEASLTKHSKHDKGRETKKRHKSEKAKKVQVIDDDADEDVWVERNIDMEGEVVRTPFCVVLFAGLTHARDVPATRDGHPVG